MSGHLVPFVTRIAESVETWLCSKPGQSTWRGVCGVKHSTTLDRSSSIYPVSKIDLRFTRGARHSINEAQ